MFAYVLELICSRPFISANIKRKIHRRIYSYARHFSVSVCECVCVFLFICGCLWKVDTSILPQNSKRDTNWADINRGLRVHWCRNLGMKATLFRIVWHFISFSLSVSFCAAYAYSTGFRCNARFKLTLKWQPSCCLSCASNKKLATQTISPMNQKALCTKLLAFKLKIPSFKPCFFYSSISVDIFSVFCIPSPQRITTFEKFLSASPCVHGKLTSTRKYINRSLSFFSIANGKSVLRSFFFTLAFVFVVLHTSVCEC